MDNDPNDTQTITPAPDDDLMDLKTNYLSHWQSVQKIFQNFWKQWQFEYLNQSQVRNK